MSENFVPANYENANFVGSDLRGINLSWANLMGANLENADLQNTSFSYANLIGAELKGAYYNILTLWPDGSWLSTSQIGPTRWWEPESFRTPNEGRYSPGHYYREYPTSQIPRKSSRLLLVTKYPQYDPNRSPLDSFSSETHKWVEALMRNKIENFFKLKRWRPEAELALKVIYPFLMDENLIVQFNAVKILNRILGTKFERLFMSSPEEPE